MCLLTEYKSSIWELDEVFWEGPECRLVVRKGANTPVDDDMAANEVWIEWFNGSLWRRGKNHVECSAIKTFRVGTRFWWVVAAKSNIRDSWSEDMMLWTTALWKLVWQKFGKQFGSVKIRNWEYQEGYQIILSKNNHGQKWFGMRKVGNKFKLKAEIPPNDFAKCTELFLCQVWHQVYCGDCFALPLDLFRDQSENIFSKMCTE